MWFRTSSVLWLDKNLARCLSLFSFVPHVLEFQFDHALEDAKDDDFNMNEFDKSMVELHPDHLQSFTLRVLRHLKNRKEQRRTDAAISAFNAAEES